MKWKEIFLLCFGAQLLTTPLVAAQTAKEEPKTLVTCNGKLDMDYDKNVAVFHDDVLIDDPHMKMNADQMTVYFQAQSRTIEKVLAVGHVRFKKEEKSAKSDQAVYTVKDGKIVLTGHPMVKKDKDILTGEKITFFRDDNRMLIEPSAKLILYSSDQKGMEKDWF